MSDSYRWWSWRRLLFSSARRFCGLLRPSKELPEDDGLPGLLTVLDPIEMQEVGQHSPMPTAPTDSPVAKYGQLQVKYNAICDEHGQLVRLRGMSLVRTAIGVEKGGNLSNLAREQARLEAVVDASIKLGVYVLIAVNEHTAGVIKFFDVLAMKYGKHPNVMFEIFGKHESQSSSNEIQPHHEEIITVIRQHTDNVVIIRACSWLKEMDGASREPVKGKNLVYACHKFAPLHRPCRCERRPLSCRTALRSVVEVGKLTSTRGAWNTFLDIHSNSDAN